MLSDAVKNHILNALKAHMQPSTVTDVRIAEQLDADGEPILRIQAVIDRDGPDLAADKVFTATAVVRKVLEDTKDTRFPLLTFPSSDEVRPEAAA